MTWSYSVKQSSGHTVMCVWATGNSIPMFGTLPEQLSKYAMCDLLIKNTGLMHRQNYPLHHCWPLASVLSSWNLPQMKYIWDEMRWMKKYCVISKYINAWLVKCIWNINIEIKMHNMCAISLTEHRNYNIYYNICLTAFNWSSREVTVYRQAYDTIPFSILAYLWQYNICK